MPGRRLASARIARYRVTYRIGPGVEHERFDVLEDALLSIEGRLRSIGAAGLRETRSFMNREFEPHQQVAARAGLRGPGGLRVGLDLRGDGSAQAWTGRFGRRPVEPRSGEDAYAALRRVSWPA